MTVPRPEYPRPLLRRRRWRNLNGWWEFGAGSQPVFDRRILVPFAPQASLSGIGERNPGDVIWYRRRFDAPSAERLLLHFGAVDYRATVWVNGTEVARHEGGHTPFSADLTAVVRPEANEVVVRAEDPAGDLTIPRGKQYWKDRSEGIFYTPTSGIWQTVWLEPLPASHIESVRLEPDLAAGRLRFDAPGDGWLEVEARLGRTVAGSWSGPAGRGELELRPVVPWRPGSPRLYDLRLLLRDRGGRELDLVRTYFGLRTVEAREGRFWLNGEPFVQRLVLDQGYFPGGLLTAPTDGDLRRDIELAQSLGFNGARKHQKVEDPRWVHWADRLGFLVWAEMPGFHAYSQEAESRLFSEWEAAVRRDRDHPSIVAWVPMNEGFGLQSLDDAGKARLLAALRGVTQALDRTRPAISNDGWNHALTDLCTLHDYGAAEELAGRYGSLEAALDPSGRPEPAYLRGHRHQGEPLIVSEFGGVSLAGDGGWSYGDAAGPAGLLETYRALVEALMAPGPVEGFCYTQLADVEQERNGLLTSDRIPKADPTLVSAVTATVKSRAKDF